MMHIGEKLTQHMSAGGSGICLNEAINSDQENSDRFEEQHAEKQLQFKDKALAPSSSDLPPAIPPRHNMNNEKVNVADDENNENKEDNMEILAKQRAAILSLYAESESQFQNGDSVYLFPTDWFNKFMNHEINELDNNISLAEFFGVPKLPEHITSTNYTQFIDTDIFLPLSTEVIAEIYKYYSFEGNLIEAFCSIDEHGKRIIDPMFLNVQTVLLVENTWNTNQQTPIQFNASMHSTLARLFQQAANYIEQHLSLENIDKRFWISINDKVDTDLENFLLLPQQFLSLNNIEYIDSTMADRKLTGIANSQVVSLIIEVNFTGSWPSLHHLYQSKEDNSNEVSGTVGTLGLNNLGNTCFMNSALQCLVHIPELADYFSYGCYKDELNLDNPLGYNGKMAKAFGLLVEELYGRSTSSQGNSAKSIAPRNFKMTLGFCNHIFAGFYQQDSQEFLSFLLDGLHEDLNRIKKKPYVENAQCALDFNYNDKEKVAALASETWEKYKLRNDSVIQDLFVGLFKSTLICPDCKTVSITFDPYNDLSLPIPVEAMWRSQIYILPLNDSPHTLEVELSDDSKYPDLKAEVAKYVKTDASNLIGFEFYSSSIYKCFDNENSGSTFLPIGDLINQDDITFIVEVDPYNEEENLIIPAYNICESSSKHLSDMSNETLCGYPLLLNLEKNKFGDFYYIINMICGYVANYTIFDPLDIEMFDKDELCVEFDKKIKEITLEHSLSENFVNELEKLKEAWCIYKNCTKLFSLRFLEINDSLELEDASTNSKQIFQVPSGKLNLSNVVNLSSLAGTIVEQLFDGTTEQLSDSQASKSPMSQHSSVDLDLNKNLQIQTKDLPSDVEMVTGSVSSSSNASTSKGNFESSMPLPNASLLENLTAKKGIVIFDWKLNQKDQEKLYKNPKTYLNNQLQEKKLKMAKTEKKTIVLEDCLKLFTRTETLSSQNSWYCPNCKDHKQADKQIQLWELPEILCIHLKRFKNQSSFSDKINEFIDFPLENFDLSPHVANFDSKKSYIYDLISVDNHYGGIGGGHYTAFAKNFNDENWYYFNDSRVTKENVEDSVTEAAYLLFYRRRKSSDSYSNLSEMIENKKLEFNNFNKLLDERQKQIAIILKNHGVSILDETDEETTTSEEEGEASQSNDDDAQPDT